MRITERQRKGLQALRCVRLKDIDLGLLAGISGPVIDGEERREIADLFCSAENVEDDAEDNVASYVVLSPENQILAFFAIRCGELFTLANEQLLILADEAWHAVMDLALEPNLTDEEKMMREEKIVEAMKAGLSINEFEAYSEKKQFFTQNENLEPNKDINRVYKVFSGAELKLLGVNEAQKAYWKSLGMHRKMGETLFWQFVVEKLEMVRKHIGVQYIYLFAADPEADGNLVNYYKTRLLHIDETEPQLLSTSKPLFDRECRFLYQTAKEISKQRDFFFENFNADIDGELA